MGRLGSVISTNDVPSTATDDGDGAAGLRIV